MAIDAAFQERFVENIIITPLYSWEIGGPEISRDKCKEMVFDVANRYSKHQIEVLSLLGYSVEKGNFEKMMRMLDENKQDSIDGLIARGYASLGLKI